MKTCEGVEVQLHTFLTLALYYLVTFMPWPLYPPVTIRQKDEGWGEQSQSKRGGEEQIIPTPTRNRVSVVQPVA
jgi:hypothetical protein